MDRVWRGSGLLLVALALALRLAAPDGWMVAGGADGPKLVICTGHMPASPDHPDGHGGSGHSDHPCVFAGAHISPAPPLLAATLAPTMASYAAPVPSPLTDQRPGRGLAAPPPPSHGPPHLA